MGFSPGLFPTQVGLRAGWWSIGPMKNIHQSWLLLSKKSDSETESDFPRFILIESLQDTKLDQLSHFLIEKNNIQKIQPKNCKETPNWKNAYRSGKQKTR